MKIPTRKIGLTVRVTAGLLFVLTYEGLTALPPPGQKIDTGEVVAFGENLEKAEQAFSRKAFNIPLPTARTGIDKRIETETISLDFDSGKLATIEFKKGYGFINPLQPYPEAWKNFPLIGTNSISEKMSRDDFISYLTAWQGRAKDLGMERVKQGDLTSKQFAIEVTRDKFVDMIHVSLGPSRRAAGGGIWSDGWNIFFTTKLPFSLKATKPGLLESISCFRDEFNTRAR